MALSNGASKNAQSDIIMIWWRGVAWLGDNAIIVARKRIMSVPSTAHLGENISNIAAGAPFSSA